jgi:hypothetical protein
VSFVPSGSERTRANASDSGAMRALKAIRLAYLVGFVLQAFSSVSGDDRIDQTHCDSPVAIFPIDEFEISSAADRWNWMRDRRLASPFWRRIAGTHRGLLDSSGGPVDLEESERRLANWGRLYQSDTNRVVQELWMLGRYHGQQYWSDGDLGTNSGWENRRYRMGGQAQLFDRLTLHAQMVSGPDIEPFYNGFTELWARWRISDEVEVSIGQQKHRFTHDRNVSSRYINMLERSQFVNMFFADYTPAITLQGDIDKVTYYTGIFSNATGRNMWESFTELNSGYSFLAAAYYEIDTSLPVDSAHLAASYLYSDANENATNLNVFQQGISGALIFTKGPASFVGEGVIGLDSERGDAGALNIQSGYFLTDRIQLVSRYQLAVSDQSDGLLAQLRYEQPAGLARGERYHAAYLGINTHLAGHRMKWMNGLEYAQMDDEGLWTLSTAIRIFWGPHSGGPFPMAQTLPGYCR